MKHKSKTYWWTLGPCLASILILEGSRTFLRPIYGKDEGFVAELLGVLPNLLAGFGMPLLPLAVYFALLMEMESYNIEMDSLDKYRLSKKQLMISCLVFTFITTVGLIYWEYRQINNYLTFDYNDIIATITGGFVSALWFKTSNSKLNIKVA